MRTVTFGGVLFALAGCVLAAQERTQTPRDFAVRLAANGVPAGVVTPESEFSAKGRPPGRDPRGTQGFRAELPKIVAEFNRRNPGFSGKMRAAELVRVSPTDQSGVVTDLLARKITMDGDVHLSVADALFKHLMGTLRSTPVTGIAGVGPMPGPSCPLQESVHIPVGARTVEAFLDDVAAQRPGLVWVVTFDPGQPDYGLKIGIVCPDGVSLRMRINQ